MTKLVDFLKEYKKAAVAFVMTVAVGAVAQGLINGAAAAWTMIVVGALSTGGVVIARNRPSGEGGQTTWVACVAVVALVLVLLAIFGVVVPH